MSVMNGAGGTSPVRAAVVAGTLLASVATVVGVVRMFAMPTMPTMPASAGPAEPLHGMPLADMPEMVVAGLAMVAVLVGALRAPRPAPVARASSSSRRGGVVAIATLGLTIDVSKTSTLGFVIPGMRNEYGLTAPTASLLAVSGLAGTAVGAIVLGRLTDRIGRRQTYLIGTLGFAVTSMCGSMPTFTGNVVMCGLMGLAVGGLAPLLITIMTDELGARAGRARVVGLSVVATAVGYLIAASSAWWLEPIFGWRVMWLIGAPTGLALLLLTPCIPHRPVRDHVVDAPPVLDARTLSRRTQRTYAFLIGVMTFGLTTWVPTLARLGGVSVSRANLLLALAALAMVPCALLVARCYRRFGPVAFMVALTAATAALLLGFTASGEVSALPWLGAAFLVAALFAVNTMAAVFLPITADLAHPGQRGRVTGDVSLANRIGGLCGPLVLAGLVASATEVLVAVSVLATAAAAVAILIAVRQRAGRRLDAALPAAAPAHGRSPSTTVGGPRTGRTQPPPAASSGAPLTTTRE